MVPQVTESAEGTVLFLIKSSRVSQYHQQNLEILSSPEGETIETSYKKRWVQPGVQIEAGQGCAIVFADSPYENYAPIRWAVVDSVFWVDGGVELSVRLGNYITEGDRLSELWNTDAAADSGKAAEKRTRPHFVFREPNPGIGSSKSREQRNESRVAAIERLKPNTFFAASTVLEVRAVETAVGIPVGAENPMTVGQQFTVELDAVSLAEDGVDRYVVPQSMPPGAIGFDADRIPLVSGKVTVAATALTEGSHRVQFNVAPDPLRSSRPTVLVEAMAAIDAAPVEGTSTVTPAAESLRLVSWLEREAQLTDQQWRNLHEDVLASASSPSPDLVRAYARVLYKLQAFDQCRRQLERVKSRLPQDELFLTLAALRTGRDIDFDAQMHELDLASDDQFELLVEALELAPMLIMQRAVRPLISDELGDDRKLDLLQRVWPWKMHDEFRYFIAEELAWNDPDAAIARITQRWSAPEIPDGFLRLLTDDIGGTEEQTIPYLHERVRRLVTGGELKQAIERVPSIQKSLVASDARHVLAPLAHDLLSTTNLEYQAQGFALICDALRSALGSGDLDVAADDAATLEGALIVAPSATDRSAAEALLESVEESLNESASLADWRAMRNQSLYPEAAAFCRNKVVHMVGGQASPWEAQLAEGLECSNLRRHESEKRKSPTADWAESVQADRDIVIILYEHIGHALSGKVEAACKRNGVTCFPSKSSEKFVLEAIVREANR